MTLHDLACVCVYVCGDVIREMSRGHMICLWRAVISHDLE